MEILVLGAAAGGGSPQWNCRCAICERIREGGPGMDARTQSSLAVSVDGRRWALIEASPDLPEQLRRERRLWPREGRRGSPVGAVVLTDADIDHIGGLLSLREGHRFGLYATDRVLAHLEASPIFRALDPAKVGRRALALDTWVELHDGVGASLGLWVRAFPVPGKVPLWAERGAEGVGGAVATDAMGQDVVGLELSDGPDARPAAALVPCCAVPVPAVLERLRHVPIVFFDGTVWSDDELAQREVGTKTGRRMGHGPLDGPDGTLAAFEPLGVRRKILVHVNNTNPVLLPGSVARLRAEAAGWEVAYDGMRVVAR